MYTLPYSNHYSNHYIEHRLDDDWQEELNRLRPSAQTAWDNLKNRWQGEQADLPNLPETELESRWIRPLLKDLWGEENYTSQIQKQGNKPDFALFPNQTVRSQAEKAKSYDDALAVMETEKWDKDLDKKPGKNQESPHGQIRRYLTALPPVRVS